MISKNDIIGTSLIVSAQQVERNISKLLNKAKVSQVQLRPHFKTHQNLQVGQIFRAQGIREITVSSIEMAQQFAADGWEDITIAIPVNIRALSSLKELSEKTQLTLVVEHQDAIDAIQAFDGLDIDLMIKVDCGYGRTGVDAKNTDYILSLADSISQSAQTKFKGLLAHFGNTYNATSSYEIKEIFNSSMQSLLNAKAVLDSKYNDFIISIGDTPSMSVLEKWEGFDEARPGNFVYYDWMQCQIGSCQIDQVSAVVACPVIAIYPERNEVVVHGGGVHFSKESIQVDDRPCYGQLVKDPLAFPLEKVEGCYMKKLSQEHGTLHVSDEIIQKFSIGDLIGVIPIHSCLSANLLQNNTFVI
jgi:D-serine deaminase-like pyridoxal phosphate-dependent protein